MPGDDQMTCDRCGGPAKFALETEPSHDYPRSRVFVCDCGRVMWKTAQAGQQQQQQSQKKE